MESFRQNLKQKNKKVMIYIILMLFYYIYNYKIDYVSLFALYSHKTGVLLNCYKNDFVDELKENFGRENGNY